AALSLALPRADRLPGGGLAPAPGIDPLAPAGPAIHLRWSGCVHADLLRQPGVRPALPRCGLLDGRIRRQPARRDARWRDRVRRADQWLSLPAGDRGRAV